MPSRPEGPPPARPHRSAPRPDLADHTDLPPVRATEADVAAIHALRRALEDWMAERGIDQWPVGSLPVGRVAAQVAAGEWWVVRDASPPQDPGTPDGRGLRATVRIVRSDAEYWGDDDTPALYVHGLMVDRRAAGSGLGRALVEWADGLARDAGATWLRLDHRASNDHLDEVYRSWGFEPVGLSDRPGFTVVLMQRRCAP